MLTMDVFRQDAFSAVSLSASVDKIDYVPDFLGRIGVFDDEPVRSEHIWVEERSTGAVILPFSPRGSAPHQTGGDKRTARSFQTLRIADASRITASELLDIREFGSEVSVKTLQSEVARRQQKIVGHNFPLTEEFHRFNCLTQAKVYDNDGTTVKYDWATVFGQSIPGDASFPLSTYDQNGAIRKACSAVRRTIQINLKGVGTAKRIIGLCGNTFWDNLTGNKEVRETYQFAMKAMDLQNQVGQEWSQFTYGDILFINYRGTDDSSFGVSANNCHFFPQGAGIFKWALSPGESFEFLGTPGQKRYSRMVLDKDRNSWADVEVYTYPLPICTMPQAIMKGVAS